MSRGRRLVTSAVLGEFTSVEMTASTPHADNDAACICTSRSAWRVSCKFYEALARP